MFKLHSSRPFLSTRHCTFVDPNEHFSFVQAKQNKNMLQLYQFPPVCALHTSAY